MTRSVPALEILTARKLHHPARAPIFAKWRKPKPIREASYCLLTASGEARVAPRRRTRLKFIDIVDVSHRFIAQCAVQDVSASGARLKIASGAALPARFILLEDGRTILATLVWRRGDLCGVRRLCPPR